MSQKGSSGGTHKGVMVCGAGVVHWWSAEACTHTLIFAGSVTESTIESADLTTNFTIVG